MVDVNTGPYFLHPFRKGPYPQSTFPPVYPAKTPSRAPFLGTFLQPFRKGPYPQSTVQPVYPALRNVLIRRAGTGPRLIAI